MAKLYDVVEVEKIIVVIAVRGEVNLRINRVKDNQNYNDDFCI